MRLLERHDFAMIWFAGLLAYIGNGMFFVALPIWVFQEYCSATLVGTATLMAIIPSVALGSLAGIFVDRWNRPRLMFLTTLVRAALMLVLAFAAHVEWFWLILTVRFGTATAMQFFAPAEQSLLPKLVASDAELVQANSLNQLNNNLGGIIGNGLGGVMLLWAGMDGIALTMTALTLASAYLVSRIRYDDRRAPAPSSEEAKSFSLTQSARNLANEWRDGVTLFITNPSIRILFLIISVATVTNVSFTTLLSVFALDTLDAGESGVGFIFMAGSIGGMIGAIILGFVPPAVSPHRLFQGSILVSAILDVMFYGYPVFTGGILVVSMAIEFLGGFPNAGINATGMAIFQTRVPERLLGRALGSLGSIQAVVMLVATPVAGVLADIFSAQSVLLTITLFLFASWIISLRLSDEPSASEVTGEAEPQAGG